MSNTRTGAEQYLAGIPNDYLPVTPNDGTDLVGSVIGIYVESSGDVAVQGQAGVTRTITVPDGHTLYGHWKRVLSTGTTATGIHALVINA